MADPWMTVWSFPVAPMTDDLVFTNEPDPSVTPPKPHRLGLPLLADKRPALPVGMQPGDPDVVKMLAGERVTLLRGRGFPGTARATMTNGPRGTEVYIRLDQGTGGWFPLDEIGPSSDAPADATLVTFQVPG